MSEHDVHPTDLNGCPDSPAADERDHVEQALRESEARYRLLVEQAPQAIVVHDGTTILFANATCARLVGEATGEALVGRHVMDFVAAPHHDEVGARIEALVARGEPVPPMEVRLRHADGTHVDVELHSAPTRYEGRPASQVLLRDITAHKRAARRLREMKAFYENVLDELPIDVAVMEPDGRYRYLNRASVRDDALRAWMIGRTPADYARRRGLDPDLFNERTAWIREVVETGEVSSREEALPAHDGTTRHILRTATPTLDDDGRVYRVVGFGVDITEQRRYEEELRAARDEAEEMSRLKSAFLATMSHEVRTPLTGIIGFAAVLEEEVEREEHREVAALVRESGERLLETLNSVLDFARLEAGAIEVDLRPVDLCHEVRATAALFRPLAERDGLSFTLDVPSEKCAVEADPAHLRRILANLFSNAVKFTDAGSVTVRLDADTREARLYVRDTGTGIDPAFLPHLFQEFRQESSGLRRRYPGSGLGLAITRRLVEQMQGRIEVNSTKGAGSTFIVSFPRA